MIYIYILKDPVTKEIKYCGKTHNIKERYIGHLKEKTFKNEKYYWINELKEKKLKPIIEIIDEVSDEDWDFWEKYWISQLKTWGFNLLNKTNGGEFSVTGFKHSEESKRKITKAQKGRKLSEEWKQNISKGKTGLKFSEEHLKNLSISHKGQKSNNNKQVYQIDMNKGIILNKFNSIKDALIYLNVNIKNGNISKVCRGILKSTFGYYWCYEKYYENYVFEKFKRKDQRIIYQYDKNGKLINAFDSIYDASKFTNIKRDGISHAANDLDKVSYYGYIWIFEGDEHKLEDKLNRCKKQYKVLQLKNDKIIDTFNNIKEASEKTNIKHIGCVINGKRKIAGGFKWKKQLY